MLLAAPWRTAKALGYRCVITYAHATDCSASLRAAGWVIKVRELPPRSRWSTSTRPRKDRRTDEVARGLWQAPAARGSDKPTPRPQGLNARTTTQPTSPNAPPL